MDTEKYKWLGSVPSMREWGTGRLARGLRTESFDVTNLKYELTIEVDRDEISDDQTGQIRIRVNQLADTAAKHKDSLLAALLNNGHSSGYLAYDGQIFFSAAHASGDSGTQDNDLTGAAATATQPTSAEMRLAISDCVGAMASFKDDKGEPSDIDPTTGMILLCPPAFLQPASEAVQAAVIGGTTNVFQNMCRVVSWGRLNTATTFFMLKTDDYIRPFIFQDREPIEFNALEEKSEESFKREKFLYGVRARYKLTYGEWRYAVRYIFT
jgi:phage major head subunit gpT-like protein